MEINLTKWQTKVWDEKSRYVVINIGRRGGKTTFGAIKLTEFAIKNPKTICWYVAPTYRQAEQILWQMLKDVVPEAAIVKRNETKLLIDLKNGSSIQLKGADNPDSLRGVRIDFCIFDEVAFFNKWEEVWKVMRPTLADSKAKVIFISTPNGFNHFKTMAERTDEDWKYYHFTTADNPHISADEIEQMRKEMDEDSFAQEILGEFRKMSGLIYKTFDRSIHMVDVPDITGFSIFRSLDFGFAHKTALGYFAVSPTGDQIYLFDGIYQSGLTIPDLSEAIRIKDSGKQIVNSVADSAAPMQIEELVRMGHNFVAVEKGADSVKSGIEKVASLLRVRADTGKPTLMISKSLAWVADEFEKYRWMSVEKDGHIKEAPVKIDDDAMDMIRYFAMNYSVGSTTSVDVVAANLIKQSRWRVNRAR